MSEKNIAEEKVIEDNLTEIEAAAAPESGGEESSKPETSTTPKKSSNKLLLFLLFILLLIAGYIFAPQQLKDEAIVLIETLTQPKQSAQPQTTTVTTPEVAELEAAPEPISTEVTPAIEIETPAEPEVISASSDEVNRMLEAMGQLERELTSLRQEQQKLEAQQHAVQRMQLRARLRWISNPVNHLSQIQLAWEEISLMPMLSADERQQAEAMLALAEKNLNALQGWQKILQTQAESLTTKEHDNIIPAYENRWLNWITEQFSVRPSLSEQEAENTKLRDALLNTSRNIEIEQWPDAKTWLQLRATLQLRVVADAEAESSASKLELPESFDAIRGDIDQLRQTAANWMGQLQ